MAMLTEQIKNTAKDKLAHLIQRYNATTRLANHNDVSEETIRTWLNEFLLIFGWDVQNTSYVLQEHVLRGVQYQRLREINSPHRRPDYTLLNGANIKTFLDAKSLDVDIFTDTDAAYQIRSYGWSAQSPCAFVSNFEQLVIYDTRFVPSTTQTANSSVIQISIDEYLDNFDVIIDHLWHDSICNNHLDELYSTTEVEGRNRVDSQFMNILTDFRKELASNLYKNNTALISTNDLLNYYTQVILDRIVFIRVCESKGIEEQEKLKSFANSNDGFWESFKRSCYMEFHSHYDGAMFSLDSTFNQLVIDDVILNQFINKLYYPFPYRFDVIPVKVIANIYEEFLGKQLVIDSNSVTEVTKEEYIRTNGAVATPEHIVEMICKQTLELNTIENVDDLLKIKVLDPCCGSGVFVVSCYECLATKMVQLLQSNASDREKYSEYYYISNNQWYLTVVGRRAIVKNCIFAIDCDEAAIEVTKMSLALKIVDGNSPLAWEGIGVFGDKILREIADNIKLGNTLVDLDETIPVTLIPSIKPMDIKECFGDVFNTFGGFTYVIGNPPYVETKHYKAASPCMHSYLTENYVTFEGKADLAVLFIERCLDLLSNRGKIGFIIQRRWFKTEYGKATRSLINNGKHLKKLIDFKATDIFKGRMVYPSIMILSKQPCENTEYYFMPCDSTTIKSRFENSTFDGRFEECTFEKLPLLTGNEAWNFENYNITQIAKKLTDKWGTFSEYPKLKIKDGIQVLWKKMYHLKRVTFANGIATGINGFNETVQVEADALRGVIYNKVFYPFKNVDPDAYAIFPYEGESTDAIPFSSLKNRFPLLHTYLQKNESRIKKEVSYRDGDYWHTYTREHNHSLYSIDKIIVPMTARDTIGTFIADKGLYMDNSNVWFVCVEDANKELMKAITCIINSTIFSVLGKTGANPQAGGYYKFNKQFLAPIPFPSAKLRGNCITTNILSTLYDDIAELQKQYIHAPSSVKEMLTHSLNRKWIELDDICYSLYEVNDTERKLIDSLGRTIDRIELLNGVN
ncbi:MAG: Eco57I restriction-modification methylase domain-containing protein [Lachnospiraceae bacterium]|nr:Eco57I restriction-modification methylase domain-containing protein [Lachnospiraceae bacterium]